MGYLPIKDTFIPLRSLRFNEADEQVWRVNSGRLIPRLSEFSFWPRLELD